MGGGWPCTTVICHISPFKCLRITVGYLTALAHLYTMILGRHLRDHWRKESQLMRFCQPQGIFEEEHCLIQQPSFRRRASRKTFANAKINGTQLPNWDCLTKSQSHKVRRSSIIHHIARSTGCCVKPTSKRFTANGLSFDIGYSFRYKLSTKSW